MCYNHRDWNSPSQEMKWHESRTWQQHELTRKTSWRVPLAKCKFIAKFSILSCLDLGAVPISLSAVHHNKKSEERRNKNGLLHLLFLEIYEINLAASSPLPWRKSFKLPFVTKIQDGLGREQNSSRGFFYLSSMQLKLTQSQEEAFPL